MNSGIEYIKYRWKAKRRHGLHSPFIYALSDKCLQIPVSEKLKSDLTTLKTILKSNSTSINITDFGAGSKRLGNSRKVSQIYNTASSRGVYGKLLYRIASYYQPKHTLELGTSLGVGTVCLASGAQKSSVTTIEGCIETFNVAVDNFNRLNYTNIDPVNTTFIEYIETLKDESFDIVFIDGHHDGNALLNYLELLTPYTNNDTIFILDDIRWSDSMFEAWNKIVNHPDFHVTIDFFRMGLAIRRKEQEKEHFTLRP